jgi:hypothetical protein
MKVHNCQQRLWIVLYTGFDMINDIRSLKNSPQEFDHYIKEWLVVLEYICGIINLKDYGSFGQKCLSVDMSKMSVMKN